MAKKLLVIDDQTGITKVVELIARQLGLNARTLNSSLQATEVFIAFKPDVLMLDMIMPEKDGIDVLNEVLLTGIPVKIVLTSGFSDSYLRLAEGVAKFHDNESFHPAQAVPARRTVALLSRPDRGLNGVAPHHAASSSARTAGGPSILRGLVCTQRSCIDSSAIRSSCSGFDPDVAQRARQAEVGDQFGHRVAGAPARPAERLADPGLALGIDRLR